LAKKSPIPDTSGQIDQQPASRAFLGFLVRGGGAENPKKCIDLAKKSPIPDTSGQIDQEPASLAFLGFLVPVIVPPRSN
jgi:hypothetical protein